MNSPPLQSGQTAVFFDGDCNLCNGGVNFLIDRDPKRNLRFASLQSDVAKELLADHPDIRPTDLDTVVVLKDGVAYERSDAILMVASELPMPWRLGRYAKIVPRQFRDAVYRLVAKNRSKLVRRQTTCRLPNPDRLSRFLD